MIQQVESNATNVMMSMPYGPDRDVLKYKLADIDRRFTAVSEKSTQRKQTLDSIQPLTEQYHDVMNAFLIYLDSAEDKLESLKRVPRDEEGTARHKADAQVTRERCVTCCLEKGCVTKREFRVVSRLTKSAYTIMMVFFFFYLFLLLKKLILPMCFL